jgi:hypothetical protein
MNKDQKKDNKQVRVKLKFQADPDFREKFLDFVGEVLNLSRPEGEELMNENQQNEKSIYRTTKEND